MRLRRWSLDSMLWAMQAPLQALSTPSHATLRHLSSLIAVPCLVPLVLQPASGTTAINSVSSQLAHRGRRGKICHVVGRATARSCHTDRTILVNVAAAYTLQQPLTRCKAVARLPSLLQPPRGNSWAPSHWQFVDSPERLKRRPFLATEASGSTTFLSLDRRCAATTACVPNRTGLQLYETPFPTPVA
ncbi:hypothetical protein CSOJ01_04140 [Colletotrichum sojae]|uniref:Secreted protein n=1 Tax=Colletotrichum sojae TaxID=2175907 RepID=A0A8H6MYZ6_9PEZI|nr:hypothetical protein CSOJ01_04140 [Colletotrichum sojae]